MNLQNRIELLEKLGKYILSDNADWQDTKQKAYLANGWFTPEFINHAVRNIALEYLGKEKLEALADQYRIPAQNSKPRLVGIVMAGNIPLVGFHDFLCVFLSGHQQLIKTSSKDEILIQKLVNQLIEWDQQTASRVSFSGMLKGCDAYIATGSNNSARYFDYYFSKYPHIIRRNRSSMAILTGEETSEDLEKLADDVHLYFGLGCRNVTKIYTPANYEFLPLLESFRKYHWLIDHHKYKNNYDYQLAVLLINKHYYMTNGSVILHESKSIVSPIGVLNYEFYSNAQELLSIQQFPEEIQCLVGKNYLPFGLAQQPCLTDWADGIDSLQFLLEL